MQSKSMAPAVQCSNCGADIHIESDVCQACGAPLAEDRASEITIQDELQDLIERSNQELLIAGSKAAESAFGLGCWLGMLLTLLILVGLIALTRDWILGAIAGFVLVLVVTGVAINLSKRAKSVNIAGTFTRLVGPDIETFLRANRFTRMDFDRMADQVLEKDAPLRCYLYIGNDVDMPSQEKR